MPNVQSGGRYTTYVDKPETGLESSLGFMLQKKLQEQQRKQELQDTIKKAVIESVLAGKGKFKTPVDMNQLIAGGQLPDLNQFEATPNYSQMKSVLGMQDLARKMENQRRLGVMGNQEAPSEEDVSTFTPQLQKTVLGGAEGGQVMLPKGATFGEGNILSLEGQGIGSYLPGYEPKTLPVLPEEIAGAMREKFAGGIGKEELQRKALGLPRFSGRATQNQLVVLATKLAQAENPMAGEKEIQAKIPTAQKMLEGNIFSGQALGISKGEYTPEQEKLIQDNMEAYPDKTEDEIIAALEEQGYL